MKCDLTQQVALPQSRNCNTNSAYFLFTISIFHTSSSSVGFCKKREHLEGESKDIHEKDLSHLADAERSYVDWAQEFPEKKSVIECYQNEKLLSPEIIHEKVWEQVLKIL